MRSIQVLWCTRVTGSGVLSPLLRSHVNRIDGFLRLSGWGTISVRVNPLPPTETRTVQWQADLRITPTATPAGSIVFLSTNADDYRLTRWEFDVLSGGPFSTAADTFLRGEAFRAQMRTWLQEVIGSLRFPIIDFSFLGPFSGVSFSTTDVQCVAGALMLGFNIDDGVFATDGDPAALADFAGANDVAVVVNPNAIKALMPNATQLVQQQIDEYDATLESLDITCEEGRFRVRGRASMTCHIDCSDWVVLVEVVGGVLTLGFLPFAVEAFIAGVSRNIAGGIASADLDTDGVTPRVRRFGNPPTRFKIEQFQIRTSGVFIGISFLLEAPSASLGGVKSIPRDFVGRRLRYDVRLPFHALADDPLLRIRWTVADLESGNVAINEDGPASNRSGFEFIPAAVGSSVDRLAVVCRVYRVLGPFTTELLNETIRLEVGPPLQDGAFVRWRYHVKNPQIRYNGAARQWSYTGDRVVERWSKFHRLDKPCQNANDRSRFVHNDETLDDLPFPIHDINGNRYRLCDYCFFGGPASTIASL